MTPTAEPTPTQGAPGGCTHWDDVTGIDLLKSERICIYGDLHEQQTVEDENGATFVILRFSSDRQGVYVLQLFDVPFRRGDCITVVGNLQPDGEGGAYMSVDSAVDAC